MTDRQIAQTLETLQSAEAEARAHWSKHHDGDEGKSAIAAVRLIIPLRRSLEGWITLRACRAAMTSTPTERTAS